MPSNAWKMDGGIKPCNKKKTIKNYSINSGYIFFEKGFSLHFHFCLYFGNFVSTSANPVKQC